MPHTSNTFYQQNIIIDGNIGSGKSTVISNLISNGHLAIEEDVNSWAPYLKQFYGDMKLYSLSFQMKILQHHMLNKRNVCDNMSRKFQSYKIAERSPLSCIHVFGQNLLNNNYISELDLELMVDYNLSFGWNAKQVIYIKTDPETCFNRINERMRPGESIPLSYLQDIDKLYNNLYIVNDDDDDNNVVSITGNKYGCINNYNIHHKCSVIIVDGNKNKHDVMYDVENIVKQIKKTTLPSI
jgi:deoxyadenosine/deoxycytidine kinase